MEKFGFGSNISKFYLYIMEYRADLIRNHYKVFKKAEIYLDILNTKIQM